MKKQTELPKYGLPAQIPDCILLNLGKLRLRPTALAIAIYLACQADENGIASVRYEDIIRAKICSDTSIIYKNLQFLIDDVKILKKIKNGRFNIYTLGVNSNSRKERLKFIVIDMIRDFMPVGITEEELKDEIQSNTIGMKDVLKSLEDDGWIKYDSGNYKTVGP